MRKPIFFINHTGFYLYFHGFSGIIEILVGVPLSVLSGAAWYYVACDAQSLVHNITGCAGEAECHCQLADITLLCVTG